MTNKEKYPNARILENPCAGASCGGTFYISLMNNSPNNLLLNNGTVDRHQWNNPSLSYYKTKEQAETALNNFMNETPEITLKEIKLQLEEAKKLVGKKIKNSYDKAAETCEKVFLAVDIGGDTSEVMNKEIREKGYCIGVKTNKRNTFALSMCKKIETVSVTAHDGQTYTAESDGDCWKFGCARISKTLIKQSLNLMNDKNFGGNRQIEKITIGKCDFTLETLKALVELAE